MRTSYFRDIARAQQGLAAPQSDYIDVPQKAGETRWKYRYNPSTGQWEAFDTRRPERGWMTPDMAKESGRVADKAIRDRYQESANSMLPRQSVAPTQAPPSRDQIPAVSPMPRVPVRPIDGFPRDIIQPPLPTQRDPILPMPGLPRVPVRPIDIAPREIPQPAIPTQRDPISPFPVIPGVQIRPIEGAPREIPQPSLPIQREPVAPLPGIPGIPTRPIEVAPREIPQPSLPGARVPVEPVPQIPGLPIQPIEAAPREIVQPQPTQPQPSKPAEGQKAATKVDPNNYKDSYTRDKNNLVNSGLKKQSEADYSYDPGVEETSKYRVDDSNTDKKVKTTYKESYPKYLKINDQEFFLRPGEEESGYWMRGKNGFVNVGFDVYDKHSFKKEYPTGDIDSVNSKIRDIETRLKPYYEKIDPIEREINEIQTALSYQDTFSPRYTAEQEEGARKRLKELEDQLAPIYEEIKWDEKEYDQLNKDRERLYDIAEFEDNLPSLYEETYKQSVEAESPYAKRVIPEEEFENSGYRSTVGDAESMKKQGGFIRRYQDNGQVDSRSSAIPGLDYLDAPQKTLMKAIFNKYKKPSELMTGREIGSRLIGKENYGVVADLLLDPLNAVPLSKARYGLKGEILNRSFLEKILDALYWGG